MLLTGREIFYFCFVKAQILSFRVVFINMLNGALAECLQASCQRLHICTKSIIKDQKKNKLSKFYLYFM